MSTFAQIRTRCAVRFQDASNVIITDATWKDYVNARYRAVGASSPYWPWKEAQSTALAVTAGSRGPTLPTDGWRVLAVYNNTEGVVIRPMDGVALHFSSFADSDSGTPQFYRVRNNVLELWPKSDIARTLHVTYLAPLTALSADGDLPIFPSDYHDLLVEGALADAYYDDGQPEQGMLHEQHFQHILEGLKADLLAERHEGYYRPVDNFWES